MKVPLPVVALTVSISVLHAGTIFQEKFEYGPGIPERAQIEEGATLKDSGITAAGNAWQAPSLGGAVVFAPGKGLTITGRGGNVSILINVDPKLFSQGSPVRAELDLVPGDLWHGKPGIPGVWFGFADADSAGNKVLATMDEAADHLVLRYAITPDPVNCFSAVETGVRGEFQVTSQPQKKIPFQPASTYRMTLVFNPADRSYEATLLDTKSGEEQTRKGTLSLPPVFNVLRLDFTSIVPGSAETEPLIKSISLTKE